MIADSQRGSLIPVRVRLRTTRDAPWGLEDSGTGGATFVSARTRTSARERRRCDSSGDAGYKLSTGTDGDVRSLSGALRGRAAASPV
jgi:hypothetical protein